MKYSLTGMLNQTTDDVLSNLKLEQSISFIEDSIHWAVKMRNRMLKYSILLPTGLKQISIAHLKMLIKNVGKEVHGVVKSDICPFDRQNFASFVKVSSERVLTALEKYIPDSEATIIYLRLTKMATDAFTDPDLSPLARIRNIWEALYFFRIWKFWIENFDSKEIKYNIEDNFISQNAFHCIELNAYGLLHLISKFRDSNEGDLFLPTLFNSQGCEQTFRQFRSMSTANWTKINFTLAELLHMIGRIDLQNDIGYFKLANKAVLPRLQNRAKQLKTFSLPSNEQIRGVLNVALGAALSNANKLGMNVSANKVLHCKLNRVHISFDKELQPSFVSEEREETRIMDSTYCRDWSNQNNDSDANSLFVQVLDETGASKWIKKSAVVWLLSESNGKCSNDRLKRVQSRKEFESNGPKRKIAHEEASEESSKMKRLKQGDTMGKLNAIEIADWCLFVHNRNELGNERNKNIFENIVVGSVLGFRYANCRKQKEKQYCLDIAPISIDQTRPNLEASLEILALWYNLRPDFALQPLEKPSFFIGINSYVGTISKPEINRVSYNVYVYKINGDLNDIEKFIHLSLTN